MRSRIFGALFVVLSFSCYGVGTGLSAEADKPKESSTKPSVTSEQAGVRNSANAGKGVIVKGPKKPSAIEAFAIAELSDAVKRLPPPGAGKAAPSLTIVVGRAETNPDIGTLTHSGYTKPEQRKEGYTLAYKKNKATILVAGADERGVLYGVMDLIHYHLRKVWTGEADDFDLHEAPRLELRGLWLWGGRMYNYEKFFDQMARWKMNFVITWHSRVPKNAVAFRDYAAARGVTVVWGYSWGWEEALDWSKPQDIAQMEDKVVNTFEQQYASLEPFGIYFQSNTEAGVKPEDRRKVVDLVNRASARILEKHPKLWISFGLHQSFKGNQDILKKVDPRVSIMYEDLGGHAFAYYPIAPAGMTDLSLCTELTSMRGSQEDIGYIFKGFYGRWGGGDPMLNKDEAALQAMADARWQGWVDSETGWRANIDDGLSVLKNLIESKAKRKSVTLLAEDGLWEVHPWYSVCLAAEAMWNPYRKKDALLKQLDGCVEAFSTRTNKPGAQPKKSPK
jgi:hypothetical protein